MAQPNRVAFCGGGTGGHIFPALAVLQAMKLMLPKAEFYYFGKQNGMEAGIVSKQAITFYGLELAGLSRSLTPNNIRTIWKACQGYLRVKKIMKELQIQAILGTGGFVCGPVIAAAASLKIPSMIHESNVVPGLTNRLLGGLADKVAVSYPATARYFDEQKIAYTGFPLRQGIVQDRKDEHYRLFGLDPSKKTIFIFPGSLAARKINQAMMAVLPDLNKLAKQVQLLWMTGQTDYRQVREACARQQLLTSVHEFIEQVPEAYSISDLMVARAGAGTIAEISATATPALLIPYPFATGDHQTYNAKNLEQAGMAEVLRDQEVTGERLLGKLETMLLKLNQLHDYALVWQSNYPKHAARDLAQRMMTLINS